MQQPKHEPREDLTLPGLAHDLNNIFQTLVDAADLLSADVRWEPVSSAILRSVERGRHITASLAEGHGTRASFGTILAGAIAFVEDSAMAVHAVGARPVVHFRCEVDPVIELRQGWAWERVLINLFLNARRAMPQGGTIHVRAFRKPGEIRISVRDEGTGIPAELLGRLFEPRVSGGGSSGLGLHIVQTIVHQDGGTIRAANLSDGAEFTIVLPASAAVVRRHRMVRAAGD